MIVLIRKWIAWLALLLSLAATCAYLAAGELSAGTDEEVTQVMSTNITEKEEGIAQEPPAENTIQTDVQAPSTENEPAEETNAQSNAVEKNAKSWAEQAAELKWQRKTQLAAEYDELQNLAAETADSTVRAQVEERMLEIKNAQKIAEQAESLLKLKGYEAAVFIEGEQISALIDKNLPIEEGIVIAEILERTSGFAKENVLVIPR